MTNKTTKAPQALPHVRYDDADAIYVVQWPNHAGDDHKNDDEFFDFASAAKEIRFQCYSDCTIGHSINQIDYEREFPRRAVLPAQFGAACSLPVYARR